MSCSPETVNVGMFKARYPEFCDAPDSLVRAVLLEAECRTDETVWGDCYTQGVMYLAAHLLAISPMAQTAAKCCDKDGMTPYMRERKKMICALGGGILLGGSPCPPPVPCCKKW